MKKAAPQNKQSSPKNNTHANHNSTLTCPEIRDHAAQFCRSQWGWLALAKGTVSRRSFRKYLEKKAGFTSQEANEMANRIFGGVQ